MGLDNDFLQMLNATVSHESLHAQPDLWGNDEYDAPVSRKVFVEQLTTAYGTGREGGEQESRQTKVMSLISDAVGMKIADRLTFAGVQYWVSSVDTFQDEFGADLYQEVRATDQKE